MCYIRSRPSWYLTRDNLDLYYQYDLMLLFTWYYPRLWLYRWGPLNQHHIMLVKTLWKESIN